MHSLSLFPISWNHRSRSSRLGFLFGWIGLFLASLRLCSTVAAGANPPDFSSVEPIFNKYCLDCHATQDPEGNLVMDTFEALMKGGESGPAISPGKSAESLLIRMVQGSVEKDGKKLIMPPGKKKKLGPSEIAALRDWIDGGALGPAQPKIARDLQVPKIAPKKMPRLAINALAYAAGPRLLAVARYGEIELRGADSQALLRKLEGHRGNVNAAVFSADGSRIFTASGENGLFGEIKQWNVADGTLIRTFEGHKDSIYGLALSPDGKILASGSYDQKIILWNIETGKESRTLSGHNGAVFGLAFRPDGNLLASASADRTVKLWDVASGERRDTLSQSLKELYSIAFSPDGKRLIAGGVDNRIRMWEISDKANETTNPLLYSRYAHEGAILRLGYSGDGKMIVSSGQDQTVKLWEAAELKEKLSLEKQPDWPSAIVLAQDNTTVVVGRLDGSLGYYSSKDGKNVAPPKPLLTRLEPRGVERGRDTRVRLFGSNLVGLTSIKFSNDQIRAGLESTNAFNPSEQWIRLSIPANLVRGSSELSVAGPSGESGKLTLYWDDLPQISDYEPGTKHTFLATNPLPASFWGKLNTVGDIDRIEFQAGKGQTLVLDLAAKAIGSKANAVLTLRDTNAVVLASSSGFDADDDPLLTFTFPAEGRYIVEVSDLMLTASEDHFYRLSMGAFPYVTSFFPQAVAANSTNVIELIGFNLPKEHSVIVQSKAAGEMTLPVAMESYRTRKSFKLLVSETPPVIEREPNDQFAEATSFEIPGVAEGRIFSERGTRPDQDLFRFQAKKGEKWIVETTAAKRGSPVDTRIEILYPDGKPVPRLLLQAVRNSAITFRGIDSNTLDARVDNWEEMELNEFLYMQGDVAKIFRMPQGPDSGFLFYPGTGKRFAYFNTTATAHALDEPCYIVDPHPPGTTLVPTGLPVFTLYYANDDDGERKLGTDSRLEFVAPADGSYLVRVTDSRGHQGDRYAYQLAVRNAKPDFKVTLNGANLAVGPGSGQSFSVTAERIDGFDGDITVSIDGLPPGFSASTPLVIQSGHQDAKGTLNASLDAAMPSETNTTHVVARAVVEGKEIVKEIMGFGKIKLGEKPKLFVSMDPDMPPLTATKGSMDRLLEVTVISGQTMPVWLRINRSGHDDLVTFSVDNLPHGVIVDNIGLSGVLIPKDQNERKIFLTAARWVPETDRLCYAIENQAGRQTSRPVLLHVRRSGNAIQAASR